jgi:hypothetical protein
LKLLSFLALSTLLAASSTVFAGRVEPGRVYIGSDSNFFSGDMSTRYSAETTSSVRAYVFPNSVSFDAQDSNGKIVSCYVLRTDANYLHAVNIASNLNSASILSVSLKPNTNQCDYISLSQFSAKLP